MKHPRPIRRFAALAMLALLPTFHAPLTALAQGSLTPPPGAPAPTMKSLDQIEARTPVSPNTTPGTATSVFSITQPGSYYLTSNLTVPAGKSGIEIATNQVTLDLNGFAIFGLSNSVDGITVSAIRKHITVRNGRISGLGRHGVLLFMANAENCQDVLEQVTISDCKARGALLPNSRVRECSFNRNNIGLGIANGGGAIVENCTASENGTAGFDCESAIISRCSVVAANADFPGITVNEGAVVDCRVTGGSTGIQAYGSSVRHCLIRDCAKVGLVLSGRGAEARNNLVIGTVTGISCFYDGIQVERNNLIGQTTGIKADGANNLIVGNIFRSCTKAMLIPAGNRVGTLLTGAFSAAIDGNSGGGLGTTDPNANLLY